MCAGSGTNIVSNTVAFNPASNQLTTVVNGIAASAILAFDAGDIVTTTPLTIGGVLYAVGTPLPTILTAIVALSHPALTLAPANNPALTLNVGTQTIKLDLSAAGSYDNTASGLTATNIQDAIDELISTVSGLPTATIGDILIHNGTEFVRALRITGEYTDIIGASLPLPFPPLNFAPFDLFRNGVKQATPLDYTRVGNNITVTPAAIAEETFTVQYYL
jgi:hypothetical protein